MPHNECMELEIGRDRKTGFPVVRFPGHDYFVAVLPVTKVQVCEWLCDAGESAGFNVARLRERMELRHVPREYPATVARVSAMPLARITPDRLVSVVATNLSTWDGDDETRKKSDPGAFPTAASEWGGYLSWSSIELPSLKSWEQVRDTAAGIRTRELIQAILAEAPDLAPAAIEILQRFAELVPGQETGLPLQREGVYELLRDVHPENLISVEESPDVTFPCAAGSSALWPVIRASKAPSWRTLMHSRLPMVGVRAWLPPDQVVVLSRITVPVHRVAVQEKRAVTPGRVPARPMSKRVTMDNRCPICFEALDPAVFAAPGGLWHWLEPASGEEPEQVLAPKFGAQQTGSPAGRVQRWVNRHGPPPPEGRYQRKAISEEYVKLIRNGPHRVRSVSLAGGTRAGKSCWILGATGMILLPEGTCFLQQGFPLDWAVAPTMASVQGYQERTSSGREESFYRNFMHQTELMWFLGELPDRTDLYNAALRSPMLFSARFPRLWDKLRDKEQQIGIVFNDAAGELMRNAETFYDGSNDKFSHLKAGTDVIFFVKASEIKRSGLLLQNLTECLEKVSDGRNTLPLNEINLILAVCQVDTLKHGANWEEELLEIFLQEPFTWPRTSQKARLAQYVSGMHQVHAELEQWFGTHVRILDKHVRRYRSVRYCGFSTLGFSPVGVPGDEHLPFTPNPVRVVDPLLWLLIDAHWLRPSDLGL